MDITTRAAVAYDAEDQSWFNALGNLELLALWELCCDIETMPAYDDEVFDALAARGYFDPCKGCGKVNTLKGGTLKCSDCVGVDIHNYTALHDGRYKVRDYDRV